MERQGLVLIVVTDFARVDVVGFQARKRFGEEPAAEGVLEVAEFDDDDRRIRCAFHAGVGVDERLRRDGRQGGDRRQGFRGDRDLGSVVRAWPFQHLDGQAVADVSGAAFQADEVLKITLDVVNLKCGTDARVGVSRRRRDIGQRDGHAVGSADFLSHGHVSGERGLCFVGSAVTAIVGGAVPLRRARLWRWRWVDGWPTRLAWAEAVGVEPPRPVAEASGWFGARAGTSFPGNRP